MNSFKTSAKIVYDPYRGEMSRRTAWWCVAEIDKEITRYCRWWLKTELHIHLQPPAWDAHISIVRGEKPRNEHLLKWKKFHKHPTTIEWDHTDIRSDVDKTNGGLFYWINVVCPELDNIRSDLGLPTGFKYHLTIGRTYDYVSRFAQVTNK